MNGTNDNRSLSGWNGFAKNAGRGWVALLILGGAALLASTGRAQLTAASQWYYGGPSSTTMTDDTGTGTVVLAAATGGQNGMIWSYLAPAGSPESLSVGDTLSLSFTLKSSSPISAGTFLRIGLFNSNGTGSSQLTLNQTSITNAAFKNYAGEAVFDDIGAGDTTGTAGEVRGAMANNTTLWSSGAFAQLATGSASPVAASTPYNIVLSLQRTSGGLLVSESVGGTVILSYTDTAPPTYAFDAVSLFYGGPTTTFTLTNMETTLAAVPEPSALLLLGAGAGLLLAAGRRRGCRAEDRA